ncbi:DUF4297 family anti-phage-associated protein [Dysgonomonas gadei]|uniref:CD-NTase associated protein 4-like DNA endonuclease domain-containing protein n=1 Tax=Dysgonomonas gadei ATCC BAA-286 TaxID=742766 RepID=F5IX87_9BACT|nr:DUF4297 family anti-phage-associated protein [Dysgonomonas gadei]EGK02434.1 hypothetical protein HMPREF9455_01704 [Dysgonomonas gadei ATCC BAA-286]
MAGRAATETIAGYIYQFDYTIKNILGLTNDNDSITIENIEDVDVHSCTENITVQCKYYAGTEYNHSVIAKPIRLMLNHYYSVKNGTDFRINYKIYGYYNSGQNKLTLPITIDFLKTHFLTYKKDKITKKHYEELGLDDTDLTDFLSLLTVDIHAEKDTIQYGNIISSLMSLFNCDDFEAEHYFYNNALRLISHKAKNSDVNLRYLTKGEFIAQINRKEILFHKWFLQLKRGDKAHYKSLREKYFTILNIPPYERFFLIAPEANFSKSELKDLLLTISRKWSKLSQRTLNPFCPYVYIHNITESDMIELKTEFQKDNFQFVDGYSFKGASFCLNNIRQEANYTNKISLRIIDSLENLEFILNERGKTKEIYQFYFSTPFFDPTNPLIKHIKIQYEKIDTIKEII